MNKGEIFLNDVQKTLHNVLWRDHLKIMTGSQYKVNVPPFMLQRHCLTLMVVYDS